MYKIFIAGTLLAIANFALAINTMHCPRLILPLVASIIAYDMAVEALLPWHTVHTTLKSMGYLGVYGMVLSLYVPVTSWTQPVVPDASHGTVVTQIIAALLLLIVVKPVTSFVFWRYCAVWVNRKLKKHYLELIRQELNISEER